MRRSFCKAGMLLLAIGFFAQSLVMAEKPKDFVTLVAIYPGDESDRMSSFLKDEFAAKLKDELNIGLELNFVPWDQYWTKRDLMIASGEQLDWYWDGAVNFSKIAGQGKFLPLNDLVDKFGPDLKKAIPADNFKAFTVNGKLVAIPNVYAPTAGVWDNVMVRQDLLEGVGMKEIKTLDDLEKFFRLAKAKYPEMKALASYPWFMNRAFSDGSLVGDGAEFAISLNMATLKAASYFESTTFKQVADKMFDWKKKGYVPDDVTLKYTEHLGRFQSGNYLANQGAIARTMENIAPLRNSVPSARTREYLIEPAKPLYKYASCLNFICVAPGSTHGDRVVQFINWIYQSKDNYNFTLFGVKGKDYKIENGQLKLISTDALFYEWMFRNVKFMDFPDSVDDVFATAYKNWENKLTPSKAFGFLFDSTPVKSQEAKIASLVMEKFHPIETGFVAYKDAYPDALKALKAAGIDAYVAEFQKQLNAYVASQK